MALRGIGWCCMVLHDIVLYNKYGTFYCNLKKRQLIYHIDKEELFRKLVFVKTRKSWKNLYWISCCLR